MTDDIKSVKNGRDGLDRPLVKRFYQTVSVAKADTGFVIQLDGRPIKTPLKKNLHLPCESLAKAVAKEWEQQTDFIKPHDMLLTKFANTAIDKSDDLYQEGLTEIVKYAGSDLICYRADHPQELMLRQSEGWDPVLEYIAKTYGAKFKTAQGIMYVAQDQDALRTVEAAFKTCDVFTLSALHFLTILIGSPLLVLAYHNGRITAEDMWSLSHLDEDWQSEHWGEDEEARIRRKQRHVEMMAADEFLSFLKTCQSQ